MRSVIICGDRKYTRTEPIRAKMLSLVQEHGRNNIIFILGGAMGADLIAENIANIYGYNKHVIPADWDRDGKYTAGKIRNTRLLAYAFNKSKTPDLISCYAYKDVAKFDYGFSHGGTEDMCRKTLKAKCQTYLYSGYVPNRDKGDRGNGGPIYQHQYDILNLRPKTPKQQT